jgi:hypothetical protein
MSTKARIVLIITLALLAGAALVTVTWAASRNAPLASGGAPTVVAYQGEVQVGGTAYTGNGYFKFTIVNETDVTFWSNDGTSTDGSEPTAAVQLAVNGGLFSVLLGDTTLGGMTQALTAEVFNQPNRYLRVWFSSDNVTFDQLTPDTRIAAVPYALQAQEAVDADTVDGLNASELGAHYQNVVVVAKSGGDYTSVQAAIDSITDAESNNQYLVWVAPGMYEEQVTMKPYVHLQGAGQEVTVIWSNASSSEWPPDAATLVLASDTSLRDLSVRNFGTGDTNTALLGTGGIMRTLVADVTAQATGSGGVNNLAIFLGGYGTSVTLQQMNALGEDGSNLNAGLYNQGGAAAVLLGGSFTGRGGTYARGISSRNSDTTLEVTGVTALGENGGNNNGLAHGDGAAAVLRGGSFTGRGGTFSWGISNADGGTTLEAESVSARGENGSDYNVGFDNYNTASAVLRNGFFTANGGIEALGIHNDGDTMFEADGVTALAEDGNSNYGLLNHSGAAAVLRSSSFTARGGATAYGIYNGVSGSTDITLEADNVTALAENGSSNYGLYNDTDGTAMIDSSQLTGSSNGLYQNGGTVSLGISQLDGDATRASGTLTCFQVYDGNYNAYTCP